MDLLVASAITLALITLISIRYRISPFFTLIGGSVLFGLLAGLTLDATILGIIAGAGSTPDPVHWRAWTPFIAIVVSVPVALFILHLFLT